MTSVHAEHVVARIERFDSLREAIGDLQWVVGTCGRDRGKKLPVLGPGQVGPLSRERRVERLGLIFGNEADGLRNEELASCDASIRIPACERQPSLNLSHAVAVVLSRLFDEAAGSTLEPDSSRAAPREELDILRKTWIDLMREHGYFARASEARLPVSLDRMFRRWGMFRGDVRTMMGMLRHLSGDESLPSEDGPVASEGSA